MARPTLVIAAVDDDMLRCWHSQLAPNFNQFDEFIFVFYSIFFLFSRSARCNTTRDPSQNTIEVWSYMNVIAVLWHNDVRWDIDAAWSWLSTEMTANGRSSPRYMFRCCSQPFELIKYWRKKNASYFVAFVNFFSLYLFFVTFFNHIYIYIWSELNILIIYLRLYFFLKLHIDFSCGMRCMGITSLLQLSIISLFQRYDICSYMLY